MSVAEASMRLRPLRLDDESQVRAAHRAMAPEEFAFAFDLSDETDSPNYVSATAHHRLGLDLAPGRVPAHFLLAVLGDVVVGRSSIRHSLNSVLLETGGHIGYCVLPQYRRRGLATEILRQSLIIARAAGVSRTLLTCSVDNAASKSIIERCGGRLDPDWPQTTTMPSKLRYWID